MKIRKHKNNKSFLITFTTRPKGRDLVDKTGLPVKSNPVSRVWATGSCKQSVLRAFLTGRDAGSISTIVREATPLVWTGRLVNS